MSWNILPTLKCLNTSPRAFIPASIKFNVLVNDCIYVSLQNLKCCVRIKTILCNQFVRKFNILKSCYHKLISLLSSNFFILNLYLSYSHLCYLFYYLIHWSRADEYSMFSSVCANWIPVITSEWPESNTDCIICLLKVIIYCRTIFT